jgi:hypothetical protein
VGSAGHAPIVRGVGHHVLGTVSRGRA